jgi:hypothetical protein
MKTLEYNHALSLRQPRSLLPSHIPIEVYGVSAAWTKKRKFPDRTIKSPNTEGKSTPVPQTDGV